MRFRGYFLNCSAGKVETSVLLYFSSFYFAAVYLFLHYNCIMVCEMAFSDLWGHSTLTSSGFLMIKTVLSLSLKSAVMEIPWYCSFDCIA